MKRGAADLNLLIVLEAILETRSVSKAAERVGLSQPAVSHALTRLRTTFNDQLLIRTPAGMVPTPRAEALAWPIRQALSGLEAILEPQSFDPTTETREFNIAVNNYAAVTLAPAIAARCALEAPNLKLTFRPSGTLNLLELMDRGEISLALTELTPVAERISRNILIEDDYVAVTRAEHPTSARRLSPKLLAQMIHLDITSSTVDQTIDDAFGLHGLSRNVKLRAPLLSTSSILENSDLVAILARNVANAINRTHLLEVRNVPFPRLRLVTEMAWPRRLNDQSAHLWMRNIALDAAQSLQSHI